MKTQRRTQTPIRTFRHHDREVRAMIRLQVLPNGGLSAECSKMNERLNRYDHIIVKLTSDDAQKLLLQIASDLMKLKK